MYNSTPELTALVEYRNAWLEAERDFAINCFSIIGCFPPSQELSENINLLNELENIIDIKDSQLALMEMKNLNATPLNDFIKELGL